jgi:aminotransferase
VTVTSFSKTLAITGWRVGYAVAPAAVAREIGKVNEYLYVCAPTPAQHAIATLVRDVRPFRELSPFYQRKRDILCDALERVGFSICRPAGAYYVLADFTALGYPDDVTANTRLIEEVGVGAVPAGDFYTDDTGRSQLRFCFAVRDEVLVEGVRRLERYGLRKSDGKTGALKSAAHL